MADDVAERAAAYVLRMQQKRLEQIPRHIARGNALLPAETYAALMTAMADHCPFGPVSPPEIDGVLRALGHCGPLVIAEVLMGLSRESDTRKPASHHDDTSFRPRLSSSRSRSPRR